MANMKVILEVFEDESDEPGFVSTYEMPEGAGWTSEHVENGDEVRLTLHVSVEEE